MSAARSSAVRSRLEVLRSISVVASLGLLLSSMLVGCGTTVARRDPTGELFPTVMGESLTGASVTLPTEWSGEPVLLLVGYEQDSQFDIDRWLLGITESKLSINMVEVPTIPGWGASMASNFINNGMRSGIPEEDWRSVVCVYEEAMEIVRFTGNENPLPGRILLLDKDGKVIFFHDRGYSVGTLQKLREKLGSE